MGAFFKVGSLLATKSPLLEMGLLSRSCYQGAYHLTENFGNSRWKVNGKVNIWKFQPKIEEYVLR